MMEWNPEWKGVTRFFDTDFIIIPALNLINTNKSFLVYGFDCQILSRLRRQFKSQPNLGSDNEKNDQRIEIATGVEGEEDEGEKDEGKKMRGRRWRRER